MKFKGFMLAEGIAHMALKYDSCKIAFTLAEVLITLGIIGVVAAMTMPTLIQKHQEKATVTRLKKVYSVLSQAMTSAVNEYGTADEWDTYSYDDESEGENTVTRYSPQNLVNQLIASKDCGYKSEGCFSGAYKELNGIAERDFENLNNRYYKFILSDGSQIAIEGYDDDGNGCVKNGYCGEIWVDINGAKFPNTAGKDLFIFAYDKNKIIPYGINKNDRDLSNTNCRLNNSGYECTSWVLVQENMDYLHCNDLSWKGKTRCK